MKEYLKSAAVVGAFLAVGFSCTESKAQVSIFTNPDSDAIVFETPKATTVVIPKAPATEVVIPSTYGESSFYVSPGGYVTRSFTLDEEDK